MTNAAELIDVALKWGGTSITPRLISHRENAVYEVELLSGRAVLRVHRKGYRTRAEIASELEWTEALANVGFSAPRPLATADGEFIARLPDGAFVTVIDWMDGTPIGDGSMPFDVSTRTLSDLYHDVGALLGQLHSDTDKITLSQDFTRPKWNRDGLTGAEPLWGRYWESKALASDQAKTICRARDLSREVLADFDEEADIGLIHSDALRENVFATDHGLALIDFDDAGFGYRMYELGSCLTQSVDEPAYAEMVEAMLDGYSAVRPLRARARALYPMFAMLRGFSALGWTVPRLDPADERLAKYVRRAMTMADDFLANGVR